MQPDDQPQYSIDYLDQIAAPPPKPGMKDKLFPIVVIAGLVVALLVGALALLGGSGGSKDDMVRLAARLQTLQSVTESSQQNIKSGDLRGTNGNLSLFLTNANRDIVDPLAANGIAADKLNESIVAKESGGELTQRLEDARLNAVFDRTYALEMSYQLETLAALMQRIDSNTKSRSLKEYLNTTASQLKPLQEQLADFTAASS